MSEVRWGVNSRKIFPRSCNWACTLKNPRCGGWKISWGRLLLNILLESLVFTFDFLATQWKGGKVCVGIRMMVTCSETRPGRPACPAPCQLPAVPARVWKLAGKPVSIECSLGRLFVQLVIMWSQVDLLVTICNAIFVPMPWSSLLQGTVYLRYICHWCQRRRRYFFINEAGGIQYTFAAGVNDTGGQMWQQYKNAYFLKWTFCLKKQPVSVNCMLLVPRKNMKKKTFCPNIFPNCRQCPWHRWCTLRFVYLCEFSKKI